LHTAGAEDSGAREGTALLDRALPLRARVLLAATLALMQADGGSIPAARSRADSVPEHPLTDWVRAEIAWLDGDPAAAAKLVEPLLTGPRSVRSLAAVTARHSTAAPRSQPLPPPAAETVAAESPEQLLALAPQWHEVMLREEVRCLLTGATDDPAPLLRAEQLAESAGLRILLGRARRGLRRHGINRTTAPAATGSRQLSPREHQTLLLVGEGLSSRRIAERLGLSTNTIETYIRSAMGKLRARTRTEAAVLAGPADPGTA
jgi:DNA-binding CsgD family transcriptional regulator